LGFPCGSAGKECLQGGRPGFSLWVEKIPWAMERLSIPVFWPGEFTKSLHKEFTESGLDHKESDMTEPL